MPTKQELHPQYVTDPEGRQTAVLLPVEEYKELLEDLDDLAVLAERMNEPTIPHATVAAEFEEDGRLPG